MPLSFEAEAKLSEFAEEAGEFALFGIALNPITGEISTFSSHQLPPGAVLAFLQKSVKQMLEAAANNELEYIGGPNGAEGQTTQTTGGKLGIVH